MRGGGGISMWKLTDFGRIGFGHLCDALVNPEFELTVHFVKSPSFFSLHTHFLPRLFLFSIKDYENGWGPAEIWTRIAGFRVQSANHYTTGPMCERGG